MKGLGRFLVGLGWGGVRWVWVVSGLGGGHDQVEDRVLDVVTGVNVTGETAGGGARAQVTAAEGRAALVEAP